MAEKKKHYSYDSILINGLILYIKRDDLTGTGLSGNKIRKLESVFADALEWATDTVLTCGGAQSNHARATAIAATMLGLSSHLILRTPDPSSPPTLEGNILLGISSINRAEPYRGLLP